MIFTDADGLTEFTEHQRTVFCVFSGDGVNRLRGYLNESSYITEGTMFVDGEVDGDPDGQVAGMMHATGLNDDDDEMEEIDAADGSQYGGEAGDG